MMRLFRIFGFLLMLSALSLCASRERSPRSSPNIILIVIDELRADHLGCYGYSRETSPATDRLAASGFVFDAAYSTASTTSISMASLFTSLHPMENGMRLSTVYGFRHSVENGIADGRSLRLQVLSENLTTLAEILASSGYRTMGVMTNPYLQVSFGFDQGFQSYEAADLEAGEVVDRFLNWIEDNADGPFFSFLHFLDVHSPYVPGPPYDEMFGSRGKGLSQARIREIIEKSSRSGKSPREILNKEGVDLDPEYVEGVIGLYDGGIRKVDDSLGRLFRQLEKMGNLDDTVVAITADHGEEFFDHGRLGHGVLLYENLIRVPLILVLPGVSVSGRHIRETVSLLDLMPTLLEIAGIPVPADASGRSFASLVGVESATGWEKRPVFAEQDTYNGRKESIRTDRYHLIRSYLYEPLEGSGPVDEEGEQVLDAFSRERSLKRVRIELFDLAEDPEELQNQASAHPDIAADLLSRLDAHLESLSPRVPVDSILKVVDPETEKRLRSLGYLK